MKRLAILVLFVAACGGANVVPVDANVPPGGRVIYAAVSSAYQGPTWGNPIRIVQVGQVCVTETWEHHSWNFLSQSGCIPVPQ